MIGVAGAASAVASIVKHPGDLAHVAHSSGQRPWMNDCREAAQVTDPPMELSPASHVSQDMLPGSLLKVPATHMRQGVAELKSWSNFPAAQALHSSTLREPSEAYEP